MLVIEGLQLALPPRTGSTWVEGALRYLQIPYDIYRGKHRIPEPDDVSWHFIPPNLPRFTIVRKPEPWLRSIYRNMKGSRLPMLSHLKFEWGEDKFIKDSNVTKVWDYYQPAKYEARTSTLADDFILALTGVGYKLTAKQKKKLKSMGKANATT